MTFTILDTATVCELVGAVYTPDPIAAGLTREQVVAAPLCALHGSPRSLCWQHHPDVSEVLAWAERVYPDAGIFDRHAFAELIASNAAELAGGWGALDQERPRDVAALRMLRRACGEAGDPYQDVLTVAVDDAGQHAPLPGVSLEAWTREMFGRLVGYYFEGEPLPSV